MRFILLLGLLGGSASGAVGAAEPLALPGGHRVVLLGSTLIEREQRYGYWELALTCKPENKGTTVRNLGWSGDTVWGEARAGFDTPREGFRRMVEQTLALKPTAILIGYGANEAFAGEAGLPRFRQGVVQLLDALAPAKASMSFIFPMHMEDLGRPFPDPTAYNLNLARYEEALKEITRPADLAVLDLEGHVPWALGLVRKKRPRLTDNGIHLSEFGYWFTGLSLRDLDILSGKDRWQSLELAGLGKPTRLTLRVLPPPPPPRGHEAPDWFARFVPLARAAALPPGEYTLQVDGQKVATASAGEWARGVSLFAGPDFEQAEKLRAAIIEKNRLYFHRYRPQNETYLFGFRKHEQGKNATEVAEFDALVAKAEAEIAKLRVPVTRTYELVPARKEKP